MDWVDIGNKRGAKMKFKPTLPWARKALKAVNETIESYKKEYKEGRLKAAPCPLCISFIGTCRYCPWVAFTSHYCTGNPYFDDGEVLGFYGSKSISQRLRRLYGWRKRLENMIRKFEEAV